MASQNHIWSPYGVSINQDPFYDDGNSPEESFQNLMTQFSQHLDGKRVYILEKIGPDSFIMTYEWKVSAVSEREMHQVFTASQIEARFPHIWTQEVVETEKAYAAPLKRHGNIIGIIGFDKDPDKPHHDSSQSVRLLGFFVSTLLYNWKLIERLQVLGYTDPLTGVGNFNRLLSALDHLSDETSLGVIFADVSGLKKINDNYGHEAGNDLLTRVMKCTLRIDPIAQNESNGAEAFLIILTGVRTSAFKDRKAAVQSIMNGIFSLFDSFFALNLTTQTVHRIKVGMSVIDEIERLPLPLFLREWARRHVFSEDWKRFLQFYDLATLVTRINESGCGYLSTFFRVTSSEQENRNGWQLHLVWLSGEPSDVKVYCGTVNLRHFMGVQMPRPMEPILARNKLVPSPQLDKMDAILPEVLWEAMLHLPEMNVYWKDVRGRFLGANDAFLHYFNLSSLDDILGQSEEELGWNVEFDPTYREEEMLLGQIPVISEEKVHCMAKGMIRTVMMNKIPLIEGGRIVGSLSWFRDVTRFTQIQAELKKKSVIDALTGALNYQGFKETQSHFVDNYQKWDLDFILIYMDLDDFKHCNDAYGHGFGDMVLQEGVKRLQKIFNHYGVVARVGGDEFIALLPIVGSEDIRRIKQEIQQSLKAPLSIDGRSYLGGISVGIARYSETEDMDALQELADQRMYEDKKKRKKMKDLTYGYLVTTEGN